MSSAPQISPELAHARARNSALAGRPVSDPDRIAAKCDLVEIGLRQHIKKTLAAAPPLGAERLARIAALFQAGGA